MKNNFISKRIHDITLLAAIALCGAMVLLSAQKSPVQQKHWEAPKGADTLKNPYRNNIASTAKGKILFEKTCVPCHGAKGKGDGVAGIALNPRPQDLTSELVQKQTDGAIFWKINTGKPPMASYKCILTDEQRWQLVNYLRQLKPVIK
jgi:mono/diheme cytochrome c family protein